MEARKFAAGRIILRVYRAYRQREHNKKYLDTMMRLALIFGRWVNDVRGLLMFVS